MTIKIGSPKLAGRRRRHRIDPQAISQQTRPNILASTLGLIGLVATTITGSIGALYLINPSLQPRESLGASIDQVSVMQAVSYSEHMAKQGKSANPNNENPKGLGISLYFHVSLKGYEQRYYTAYAEVYDPTTHRQLDIVNDESFVVRCGDRIPRTKEQSLIFGCWITSPPPGTKYAIRALLYDFGKRENLLSGKPIDGDLLAFAESAPLVATKAADK
jgi:hypothetical protein